MGCETEKLGAALFWLTFEIAAYWINIVVTVIYLIIYSFPVGNIGQSMLSHRKIASDVYQQINYRHSKHGILLKVAILRVIKGHSDEGQEIFEDIIKNLCKEQK